MINIRKNNAGFRLLQAFWARHCTLEDFHLRWARRHVDIIGVRRNQVLYHEGDRQKMVYLVCRGMLARVTETDGQGRMKRRIMNMALPYSALTSTSHLYSASPLEGHIISLRAGIVAAIPYKALKTFKESEPAIDTLIDILGNKNKRQLERLLQVLHSTSPLERYLLFDELMPEIRNATSQREQADFLGISRDTVQKAQKFLLKRKKTSK